MAARRRGSAPWRGRARRSRARPDGSTGAAPSPCARPPRACARPTRRRRARAGAIVAARRRLLERPAQEPHRLLGRPAVADPARRRRQRVERPSLADGPGGRRGQQVGGRALVPRRVARQLASRGQMELRPLGRRDRVEQRLLDDRMQEPRRQTWMQELGVDQLVDRAGRRLAVHGRDRRASSQGGVVADDRERPRDGPDRRRAATEPGGHEAGHRRRPDGRDRAASSRAARRRAARARRSAGARAAGSRPSSGRIRRTRRRRSPRRGCRGPARRRPRD